MVLNLILEFLLGALIAVLSSLPVGPTNIAIVQATLNKGKRSAYLVGLGGLIAELMFCFVALFGYHLISGNPTVQEGFLLLTIVVLAIFGIITIKNRHKEPAPGDIKTKASSDMLLGFTLCGTNPMLFAYWANLTTQLQAGGWLDHAVWDYTAFTVGVGVGIGLFFFGLIQLTSISKNKLSLRTRALINLIIGLIFVGFAVYLSIRYVIDYYIHPKPANPAAETGSPADTSGTPPVSWLYKSSAGSPAGSSPHT